MSTSTTKVSSPVRHQDLTDQQITTVRKKVINEAKHNEYFDQFCEHETWEKGSKTMSCRRLVYPKVKPSEVVPSQEGIAPRPTKIKYATFLYSVDDYRDKVEYTDESKRYNFDDVVRDSGDVLGNMFGQKLDYVKGKPFISSKATVTPVTVGSTPSLLKTMSKAKIILGKNKGLKWGNGSFLMMATPEVLDILNDELEAKGSSLDEATKKELANGCIYQKKGFIISECPSDLLIKNDSTHYVVFLAKTPEGKKPVTARSMGEVEVINNGLGSGILLDEDGNITNDANHQKGSVAVNALGLGAHINDDMCILVCEFPVETVAGSELEESGRSNYVSESESPE